MGEIEFWELQWLSKESGILKIGDYEFFTLFSAKFNFQMGRESDFRMEQLLFFGSFIQVL